MVTLSFAQLTGQAERQVAQKATLAAPWIAQQHKARAQRRGVVCCQRWLLVVVIPKRPIRSVCLIEAALHLRNQRGQRRLIYA